MNEVAAFIRAGMDDYHASGRLRNSEWSALYQVVDACERALDSISTGHRADFAQGVLGHLAGIWRDEPGYDLRWATDPLPYLSTLEDLCRPPSA